MNKLKSYTLFILSIMMIILLPGLSVQALEADSDTIYDGIDVSEFQGDIDFQEVSNDGIDVVYIRAGEGSDFTDPYFRQNAERAREANLHYGFYLYVTARNTEEALSQAQFFADLIESEEYTARPAMDFEEYSGLSRSQLNAIAISFLEELERLTGVRPMIYSDAYAASDIWEESLGAYPLWVANYFVSEPDVTSDIWDGWSGFQYSDEGRINGIQGDVDLDRFTDTVLLADDENPSEPQEPDNYIDYTVRSGDTLYAIARRYNTTIEAIVELNNIANPNLIYTGEVLRIPVEGDYTSYTVVSGDTLSAIARRYGTTVSAIVEANNIANPNRIYIGEVLRIPNN